MANDDNGVSLSLGVPFIGGSDDPSEVVGCESSEEGETSPEDSDEPDN
jgi:hypothetical protein